MRILELANLAPESFYLFGTLLLLLFGAFRSGSYQNTNLPRFFNVIRLGYVSMLLTYYILLLNNSRNDMFLAYSFFHITPVFSLWIQLVTVLFIILMLFTFKLPASLKNFEIIILIAIVHLGMTLMLLSNHFLLLYLGLELQTLAIYVILALNRHSVLTLEAAIKYIVLSAMAGGVYFARGSFYLFSKPAQCFFLIFNCCR